MTVKQLMDELSDLATNNPDLRVVFSDEGRLIDVVGPRLRWRKDDGGEFLDFEAKEAESHSITITPVIVLGVK